MSLLLGNRIIFGLVYRDRRVERHSNINHLASLMSSDVFKGKNLIGDSIGKCCQTPK